MQGQVPTAEARSGKFYFILKIIMIHTVLQKIKCQQKNEICSRFNEILMIHCFSSDITSGVPLHKTDSGETNQIETRTRIRLLA